MNGGWMIRIVMGGALLLATSFMNDSYAAEVGAFRGSIIANGTRTPFPFGGRVGDEGDFLTL